MDRDRLLSVYKHYISEANKNKKIGTNTSMADSLICYRIAEMLWLLYTEKEENNK